MKTYRVWSKETHSVVLEIRTFSPQRAKMNAIDYMKLDNDADFDEKYEVLP